MQGPMMNSHDSVNQQDHPMQSTLMTLTRTRMSSSAYAQRAIQLIVQSKHRRKYASKSSPSANSASIIKTPRCHTQCAQCLGYPMPDTNLWTAIRSLSLEDWKQKYQRYSNLYPPQYIQRSSPSLTDGNLETSDYQQAMMPLTSPTSSISKEIYTSIEYR